MKRNIRFLVSYKCFNCRTLIYNSCYTHMHINVMLMRCFNKAVQRNTEGVKPNHQVLVDTIGT